MTGVVPLYICLSFPHFSHSPYLLTFCSFVKPPCLPSVPTKPCYFSNLLSPLCSLIQSWNGGIGTTSSIDRLCWSILSFFMACFPCGIPLITCSILASKNCASLTRSSHSSLASSPSSSQSIFSKNPVAKDVILFKKLVFWLTNLALYLQPREILEFFWWIRWCWECSRPMCGPLLDAWLGEDLQLPYDLLWCLFDRCGWKPRLSCQTPCPLQKVKEDLLARR